MSTGAVLLTFPCVSQLECSPVCYLARLLPCQASYLLIADRLSSSWAQGILQSEIGSLGGAEGQPSELTASYMGLALSPGSSVYRRLDCKVFAHEVETTAINFFVGSGSFLRSLRNWARKNPVAKASAQQLAGEATGFKLSDKVSTGHRTPRQLLTKLAKMLA